MEIYLQATYKIVPMCGLIGQEDVDFKLVLNELFEYFEY